MPTSSTTEQIAIGDCLAIAALNKKKFSKKHYKLLHPHGSIGNQLKTTEDLMISKNGIPFINENSTMKKALGIITKKKTRSPNSKRWQKKYSRSNFGW